jgi:hypothetical protein
MHVPGAAGAGIVAPTVRATGRASEQLPRRLCGAGRALALAAPLFAALLAGCGGGGTQDSAEKQARYRMRLLRVDFPANQAVARPARLEVEVRNVGLKTVPAVVVTVDSFSYSSSYAGLADNRRPVWVVERGPGAIAKPPVESLEVAAPGGAQTAYVSTWALGALPPGRKATFAWDVTPVKPGTYTLHFGLSAGLSGKATVTLAHSSVRRALTVHIAPKPPPTHVNPKSGTVTPGPYKPGSESESAAESS